MTVPLRSASGLAASLEPGDRLARHRAEGRRLLLLHKHQRSLAINVFAKE